MTTEPTTHLPNDVASSVEAQVAAGNFPDVDSVLRAGMKALEEREELAREWLSYLRLEAAKGFAELDRGEGIRGSPAELMASVRVEFAKLTESEAR